MSSKNAKPPAVIIRIDDIVYEYETREEAVYALKRMLQLCQRLAEEVCE